MKPSSRDTPHCSFMDRLSAAIQTKDLDIEVAIKLSSDLHAAELAGYKISQLEDALWAMLTHRIHDARKSA